MTDVFEKDYIFVRDWPALGHLVYNDYRGRKMEKSERKQCPFATTKKVSLKRLRGFAYPLGSPWKKLFDPV
jgi:glutamate receptor, ionotropic, invertebrate